MIDLKQLQKPISEEELNLVIDLNDKAIPANFKQVLGKAIASYHAREMLPGFEKLKIVHEDVVSASMTPEAPSEYEIVVEKLGCDSDF